jgi:hypothetical protein
MADPAIKVIPTPYQDVLALLHSDVLRTVEQAIATEVGKTIVEDYSVICTSYTQADMSVSGMTVAETEALLRVHRDGIIKFGIAFLRDEEATTRREAQDSSERVEVLGVGVGFGIKYAIYYNFLAHRSKAEFLAYLKNRRIGGPSRFARDLRRVFDSVQ